MCGTQLKIVPASVENTILLLDLIIWDSWLSLELHLGKGGDLVQPDGLIEIVELLRPNQLLTGDQADQQSHCLKQGHWSSIHYFGLQTMCANFLWLNFHLMKPKGCVNQRQTHKLHLLWNEITSPRLILKCEPEQLSVLTRGQVSKSSWGSDFMVSFYV